MANSISLTIRLPHELNMQLTAISKEVGITKTNLLRSAINDFLTKDEFALDFSTNYSGKSDRLVLNVNHLTHSILDNVCKKHGQSMNAVVTAVSILALERSAKWLQSAKS